MGSCETDIILGMLQNASLEYAITVPTKLTVSNTLIYAQLLPFYHFCNIPCVRPEELPEDIVNNLHLLNNILFEVFEEVFGKYTILITDIEMIPLMDIMKASASCGRETFIDFCSIFMDNKSSLREEINLNGSHTLLGNILNDKNLKNTVAPLLLKNAMRGGANTVEDLIKQIRILESKITTAEQAMGAGAGGMSSADLVQSKKNLEKLKANLQSLGGTGSSVAAPTRVAAPTTSSLTTKPVKQAPSTLMTQKKQTQNNRNTTQQIQAAFSSGQGKTLALSTMVSKGKMTNIMAKEAVMKDELFNIIADPNVQAATRALKYLLATLGHSSITGDIEANTQIKDKVKDLFRPQIEALREKVEIIASTGNAISLQGVKAGLEVYRTTIEENFGKKNVLSILPGTFKDAGVDIVLAGLTVAGVFTAMASQSNDVPSPYDMSQQPSVELLNKPMHVPNPQNLHIKEGYQATYEVSDRTHLQPGVTPTPMATPTPVAGSKVTPPQGQSSLTGPSIPPTVQKYASLADYYENKYPHHTPVIPEQSYMQRVGHFVSGTAPTPLPTPAPTSTPPLFTVNNKLYATSEVISSIDDKAKLVNPVSHMHTVNTCPTASYFNPVERRCVVLEEFNGFRYTRDGRKINIQDLELLDKCKQKDLMAPLSATTLFASAVSSGLAHKAGASQGVQTFWGAVPIISQYVPMVFECAPVLVSTGASYAASYATEKIGSIATSSANFVRGVLGVGLAATSGYSLYSRMLTRYNIRSAEAKYLNLYAKIQDEVRKHCRNVLFDTMKTSLEVSAANIINMCSSQDYHIAAYFVNLNIITIDSKISFLAKHKKIQDEIDKIKIGQGPVSITSKESQIAEKEQELKNLVDDFIFNGILPGFINYWYGESVRFYKDELERLNKVSKESDPLLALVSIIAEQVAKDKIIFTYAKQILEKNEVMIQEVKEAARTMNMSGSEITSMLKRLGNTVSFWPQYKFPNVASASLIRSNNNEALLNHDTLVTKPNQGLQFAATANFGSNATASTNNTGQSFTTSKGQKAISNALRSNGTTRTPTPPGSVNSNNSKTGIASENTNTRSPVASESGSNTNSNTNTNNVHKTSSKTQEGGRRRKMRKTRKAKKHAKRRNIHTRKH